MQEPCISIIIPVYNVEKYLRRCLDSVTGQTYRNLQIILVDDGSTDSSGAMCDEYEARDARITVVHQKNAGTSQARNTALELATGAYTTFVDSDDNIETGYIETLESAAERCAADVVICYARRFRFDETGKINYLGSAFQAKAPEYRYSQMEALECLLYQREIDICVWGKLYKTKLFADVRFPVDRRFEDIGTTYRLLLKSTAIVAIDYDGYNYLQRSDSFIHHHFDRHIVDGIVMVEQQREDILKKYPELENAARCSCLSMYFHCFLSGGEDLAFQVQCWEKIKRDRWKVLFDPRARKKARLAALLSFGGKTILKRIFAMQKEAV